MDSEIFESSVSRALVFPSLLTFSIKINDLQIKLISNTTFYRARTSATFIMTHTLQSSNEFKFSVVIGVSAVNVENGFCSLLLAMSLDVLLRIVAMKGKAKQQT